MATKEKIQNVATLNAAMLGQAQSITTAFTIDKETTLPQIDLCKTADKQSAQIMDEIEYTVTITVGYGDDVITGAFLSDDLDDALQFVPGTLTINGEASTDDLTNISLDLHPNNIYEVKYKCIRVA